MKRAAVGGEGYVLDHFNATAVANYLKRFDEAFAATGQPWPHSFFNDSYEVYNADWTPGIFEEFLKYRGYKLEEHMDQLLGYNRDTDYQVLADYRETLGDMLLNNFTRQWTAWAHGHGATTRNQGHGSPANLIDVYAAVDIPEIEGFGLTNFGIRGLRTDPGFFRANYSDFSTLKYASSAAHVTGKPYTSSETFTWLTEHFRTSLSQMKPDLDLMFVAGVNHVFFHGTTYSPREAQWPGWKFYASIDMSPTNSIWRDAPYLMQYIERCQSFLQMGQPDNDLLVYAPFHYAWHKGTGTWKTPLQLFDINTLSDKMPELKNCVGAIEAAGLDCDYISDQLLLTTSFVDGQLQTAAGTRYRGLVVPVSKYMPAATQSHLDALAEQGAKIVYAYDNDALASIGAPAEELRTRLGLRMLRRKNDTGHHYFISNLSAEDVSDYVKLTVDFQSAVLFDPMTGSMSNARIEDGRVYVSLKSGQSVVLQTYGSAVRAGSDYVKTQELNPQTIVGPWTLKFTADTYPAEGLQTYQLEQLQPWQDLDDATGKAMGTGIYETSFEVSPDLHKAAAGGFRLDLGDVRESARVYVNDVLAGCAWSAPFIIDCGNLIREGRNTLRIEVTNLPANRIRQMDADGTVWRIFKDVNILDIVNGSEGSSGVTSYAGWDKMPSGLNSTVRLIPLLKTGDQLMAALTGFTLSDGSHYATYQLTTGSGLPIVRLTAADASGRSFTGFSQTLNADGSATIVMTGLSEDYVVFTAADANGRNYQACLLAKGAYEQKKCVDFTGSDGPECGWNSIAAAAMTGFDAATKLNRYISKKSGVAVTEMFSGLTFTAGMANYYYFYPQYGMMALRDGHIVTDAARGDIALLSYLHGTGDTQYAAADSVVVLAQCEREGEELKVPLHSMNDGYVYRTYSLYSPRHATGVQPMLADRHSDNALYNLQGQRVLTPRRGIYLQRGRKIVVKSQ